MDVVEWIGTIIFLPNCRQLLDTNSLFFIFILKKYNVKIVLFRVDHTVYFRMDYQLSGKELLPMSLVFSPDHGTVDFVTKSLNCPVSLLRRTHSYVSPM